MVPASVPQFSSGVLFSPLLLPPSRCFAPWAAQCRGPTTSDAAAAVLQGRQSPPRLPMAQPTSALLRGESQRHPPR